MAEKRGVALTSIPDFPADVAGRLAGLWITTAQELVSAARLGGPSGLATALGISEDEVNRLVNLATAALPPGAPWVYVGSADGEFAPAEAREQVLPHDRFPPMVLHVRKPSAAWSQAIAAQLARAGARYAVVVSLGVSQYPKGREGAFGKKVVLGTGHEEPIEFLTAEDKLLEVLQLTGVLVDAQGRVVRAGAEGILARDTPFAAQVIDVSKVLDDRTLERVLTKERRTDLPGDPLKWEVALGNLLAQLRGDRAALRVP
jgi:DNA-binding transcriptional regulator YdaS (Cro superfamily)